MKKKNFAVRLGAVALMLTLVTTSLTSGTLAKYVGQETTSASAYVAAFKFKAGNSGTENVGTMTWSENIAFVAENYTNPTAIADSDTTILAPGATGHIPFAVSLTGTEVAVKLEASLTGTATRFPSSMKWGITTTSNGAPELWKPFPADGASVNLPITGTGITNGVVAPNPTDPFKFYIVWTWPYEGDEEGNPLGTVDQNAVNSADTSFAGQLASPRAPSVTVNIRATQVDPTLTP